MKTKTEAVRNTFPCALCKQELVRRTDKKNKPYFVCEECGTQFFIRYRTGIAKLEALMQAAPEAKRNAFKLPAPIALGVTKELDLLDEGSELVMEAEEIGGPNGEEMLPIPQWIEARTARVRSLLNLK